ncbi:MAG: glycine--tRNA ligase subunit beta, partial [Micrococcales bacterium]|nr:glycine--tRNA ligase subunit beta [Micrococcales bacterium]
VWLDGMEITQFTYFQQVGGQNLDPIPVELTYGMERILMALQGVTHFKDIAYSRKPNGDVITFGVAFGQQEYEMSRYYLDDADVEANRRLYQTYIGEAARMVQARLPVPAHQYILKSSHAFNVLDSRGAISTTERAQAFATMRRLMRDTAAVWIARREELGLPLMREDDAVEGPTPAFGRAAEPVPADLPTTPQTLAFEIGIEELPPHVVTETIEAVRAAITDRLDATRLAHGEIRVDGTPRRIVVTVAEVAAREPDTEQQRKGPKWSAAFAADGSPTKALQGFARGQGVEVAAVERAEIGGNEHAVVAVAQQGRPVLDVLSGLLAEIVTGLRAEKNMRWSDPQLSFSRAIRWLVALWGPVVVPVTVSRLAAGRTTYLQRATAGSPRPDYPVGTADVATADDLEAVLAEGGIQLSSRQRRDDIVEQVTALAAGVGGTIDIEGEKVLLDEITNLVEDPHGVRGDFDPRYLELPEQVLTTVMRKHQRYLPVRSGGGRLLPNFVTVANGRCDDATVQRGNESVIRARYEDALFFWNADLRCDSVDAFVPGLEALTFENRLGSVGQRARRIADLADALADRVGLAGIERETLARAGALAKFDLATQMVVEMSSLAGFVAREYALRKGESPQVAAALYEMEQPRTGADAVPASTPGALLAVADRADLLMAMFALGAKPTGSSDPFGLRRAALGLVRILREAGDGPLHELTLRGTFEDAAHRLREQGVQVPGDAVDAALEFTTARFAQLLRDEGVSADLVTTVLPGADQPGRVGATVTDVEALRGDLQFRALVESIQRIERIVPAGTPPTYDPGKLGEPAEVRLRSVFEALPAEAGASLPAYAAATGPLVEAVAVFFDDILVMAKEEDVKAARLGLLEAIRESAPSGVDYRALDALLG